MDFILQNKTDTHKLLADGPTTTTKAVLNYADSDSDLKIKIELAGGKDTVNNGLAAHFQVVTLGDKTSGTFAFVSRQTKLDLKPEPDPTDMDEEKKPGLNESDIDEDGLDEAIKELPTD